MLLLLFSIVLALLYAPFNATSFHRDGISRRILLITAHPDDECMFFAPTILGLTSSPNAPELFSLCLSVGDADGLGQIRKDELGRSLDVLGVDPTRRWVVDHPDLQDNFTVTWEAKTIANVIGPYILDHKIDTVLTFDYEGISSHPNHKSLPGGIRYLARSLHEAGRTSPRVYTLITVPLYAKYTAIFAPLLAKFDLVLVRVLSLLVKFAGRETALSTGVPVSKLDFSWEAKGMPVYVSGIQEYMKAVWAMRMHASQLVWFRWLYISFSRYMWVNEWAEIQVL